MKYPRHTISRALIFIWVVGLLAQALFAADPPVSQKSLRWRSSAIRVSISRSLYDQPANIKGDALESITNSLESWQRISRVLFSVADSELLSISNSGVRGDGISLITSAATAENIRLFPKQADSPPATTRIFYDRTGLITEADIVLNPFVQFSTDGMFGTYDLQSTITHEIGHLLGLEHSSLLGSTMFERAGRNGLAGVAVFPARNLSRDDIAAARSLYGAPVDDLTCCGSIAGKVTGSGLKTHQTIDVWVEDAESGQVVASKRTPTDIGFNIAGVPEGNYRVFAQSSGARGAAVQIGKAVVTIDEESSIQGTLKPPGNIAKLEFIGLNGQLSSLPIQLNAAQTSRLFVGGKGLNPNEVIVGIQGPYFEAVKGSQFAMDYGNGLLVASVEIRVAPDTPAGEYSVFVQDAKGSRRFLTGAVVIE
jgi:hypothetical protein